MRHNFTFTDADAALPVLCGELLRGDEHTSRAGRVRELMHVGITLTRPKIGLLNPNRRANLAAQIAETAWLLAGRGDVEFLSHYLPRSAEFSDDGEVWRAAYGPRIRDWRGSDTDQLKFVVDELRGDPTSRRAVINIWDPEVDTTPGKDIPCNDWLSFSSRMGFLDLHVAVRSNDLMWGWSGINTFEWAALQHIVARVLGLETGGLHFSTTSLHLYSRHWKKAQRIEEDQVPSGKSRSPEYDPGDAQMTIGYLDLLLDRWFEVERDIREDVEGWELRIAAFPEPMLQSWLKVLAWYWHDQDYSLLSGLEGTQLWGACMNSYVPPELRHQPAPEPSTAPHLYGGDKELLDYMDELHRKKSAAYGDSWRTYGEQYSIIPNIARKIDRLGKGDDLETNLDTAVDLLIYLAKYYVWAHHPTQDENEDVRALLERVLDDSWGHVVTSEDDIYSLLHRILEEWMSPEGPPRDRISTALSITAPLVRHEWWKKGNLHRSFTGYDQ